MTILSKKTISAFLLFVFFAAICTGAVVDANGEPDSSYSAFYAWYKADSGVIESDGTSAENGDSIIRWENALSNSSRDLDVVVGPSGSSPNYKTDAIAAMPTVEFNNAKGLQCPENDFGTVSQPSVIFIVCQQNADSTDYIFDSANSANRNLLASSIYNSQRYWVINSGIQMQAGSFSKSQFLLHTIVFNGSNSAHYINGQLVAQGDTGSAKALAGLTVGIHVGLSGNALDGYISEMLIYDNLLTADERGDVEMYLLEKYELDYFCGSTAVGYPVIDLNKDCQINFADFAIFCEYWLGSTDPKDPDSAPYSVLSPNKVDVFWQGQDGIDTYRIPSLTTTCNGVLLAFAEARKVSSVDLSPTKLVLRRSLDKGQSWEPIQTLVDVGNDATADPTALVDADTGRVWLCYEVFPYDWSNNPVPGLSYPSVLNYLIYSDDDGQNWSSPIDISPQIKQSTWYGMVSDPGIGIQITQGANAGRLVFPGHYSTGNFVFYSDDHGLSWQRAVGFVTDIPKGIEHQVVELDNGDIMMSIRSAYEEQGYRKVTTSWNGGSDWMPVTWDYELVSPHCMASIIRYKSIHDYDTSIILFSNPADQNSRKKLTIRASYDEGQSWEVAKLLHSAPASYSCLTVLKDSTIGCLYENSDDVGGYPAEKISFSRFNYEWLISDL